MSEEGYDIKDSKGTSTLQVFLNDSTLTILNYSLLMSEEGYDIKDSKGTQTLQVFLNDSTLTILNYSLLDSSLNIKLECKSKKSKEILQKE